MQMLGNLRNPPEPFGDVIRTHFRLKARMLMAQLDDWLALDDGRNLDGDGGMPAQRRRANPAGGSTTFQRDVEELKQALQALANGEELPPASANDTTTPELPPPPPPEDDDDDDDLEDEDVI